MDVVRAVRDNKPLPLNEADTMGSRFSGKTTTIQSLWVFLCNVIDDPSSVAFAAFRAKKEDDKKLFDDFTKYLDSLGEAYSVKVGEKKITYKGNTMQVFGLNSTTKSDAAKLAGLPKFGKAKYVIIFFEERYEFSQQDISYIKQAVRTHNKDTQFLYLSACNPWSRKHPYIASLLDIQPFNLELMKTTGNQIGIYDVAEKDPTTGIEIKRKRLIQYTNWRVVKDLLSEGIIMTILNTWKIDKARAAVVDWGLPGYEAGAIYTHLLGNIGKAMYIDQEWLSGGVDYGWGTSAESGKTVAHFCGGSMNDGIDLYDEYVQDNHINIKSPNQVSQEVVQFYINAMGDYCKCVGSMTPFYLTVRVDNANDGFIQLLNNVVQSRRIGWLTFTACQKFPIEDRILIVQSLMGANKLRFSNKIKLLRNELENSTYDENSKQQKRVKKDDHAINAFEYAIEGVMYRYSRNMNVIGNKLWK